MNTFSNNEHYSKRSQKACGHAEPLVDKPVKAPLNKVKRPSLYHVLLLNDDFTPMEFVVSVIQKHFGKSAQEAHAIMLQVHHQGSAICGTYTYEVAETKIAQVMELARLAQHPLQCTLEKAEG